MERSYVFYIKYTLFHDDDEYYATAKRLVDEITAGIDLRSHLVNAIPMEDVSSKGRDESTYLRDILKYLHVNHEQLSDSDSRVIEWREIEGAIE